MFSFRSFQFLILGYRHTGREAGSWVHGFQFLILGYVEWKLGFNEPFNRLSIPHFRILDLDEKEREYFNHFQFLILGY